MRSQQERSPRAANAAERRARHDVAVAPPVYQPMLAASGGAKVRGDWAAEPKLDGWRALVTVDPSLPVGFEVRSRTGRFLTPSVPQLAGLAELGLRMVLDGELVAVANDNVDFYALGQRMLTRKSDRSVTFCAFDVLWLDGMDCTQVPYRDRRRVLEMLDLSGPSWCTVPWFEFDDADHLLDACVRLNQEGIVLKRLDSRYLPGVRTDVWRKVKTPVWRREHAPRRVPKEIHERIVAAQIDAMRRL
jgi:bifunctional non-homologous end joining protein LigD